MHRGHAWPRLAPLSAIDPVQWRQLAESAREPNGYYLPEWAQAVNGSAQRRADTFALAAFVAERGAISGLVPVITAWRAYRLPLPALVSADPYRSLDTPLLAGDTPAEAAASLIDQARSTGARALVLRLMPLRGPVAQAFTRALLPSGQRPTVLNAYARASLDATRDADTVLRDALGKKKRKDLRRLRNRLAEHGEVRFSVARTEAEVTRAFDLFLQLEASGWKGRRGTAMARQSEDAARMRDAAAALAARGQCEIVSLHAGDTPVAAGIVLRHQDRAFFFKIGIDETFARYSPGSQLTIDLTRHLCADPAITMADSTASPNHPMIDPIWRGRMPIGDLLIPLRPRDPMVGLISAALRAHSLARKAALFALRR